MFQIKIYHNTNLTLIWPHCHFQQNVKVPFCQKYWRQAVKMCYCYAVIGFVCGSSTGTWSPEKCVIGILSTNLYVVKSVLNTGT